MSAVRVNAARARVDCHARLNVTSDGPLTVTLAGCPGGQSLVAAFGRGTATCASLRRLTIRLRHPAGTRVLSATVFVGARRVRSVRAAGARGGLRRLSIDLRGLARGTVRVRVVMRVAGRGGRVRTVVDRRTYHTCAPRRAHALRGRHRRR